MSNSLIIAVDVSKKTLDFNVRQGGVTLLEVQIANTPTATQGFYRKLDKQFAVKIADTIFSMEATGIYTRFWLKVLQAKKANAYIIHAPEIQQSIGLKRGKSDKIDAARIADYTARFADKLRKFEPVRPVLQQIEQLTAVRNRITKSLQALRVPVNEAEIFLPEDLFKIVSKASKKSIKALEESLEEIDKQLEEIQKSDEKINRQINIMRSVPGIGVVTSFTYLIATNEFTRFDSAKKLACHAGVVPFANQSGTCLKQKPKISHQANKKLKTALHISAMAVTRCKKNPLKDYYERKVAEGKNKMSALNALRCKIVNVMFACIRENKVYDANFSYT